jgi:hypothetical protein
VRIDTAKLPLAANSVKDPVPLICEEGRRAEGNLVPIRRDVGGVGSHFREAGPNPSSGTSCLGFPFVRRTSSHIRETVFRGDIALVVPHIQLVSVSKRRLFLRIQRNSPLQLTVWIRLLQILSHFRGGRIVVNTH